MLLMLLPVFVCDCGINCREPFSAFGKGGTAENDLAVFLLALAALLAFNLSPIVIVLLAAAVGLAQYRQESINDLLAVVLRVF